ncbi:MAG: mucoidy inhibitor MuiA family protein [Ardenticatenaceae bacterium]|nr:mucoidy inhibitor MuiA family protein [Anaerolineales bacterium]MCB8922137.1 mucoidy inhibitor MuiA family protein [Ardenticatenaceae bacterium]MCB8991117.1 mucoidy inhibitor MuiA family protein [Ardenticatenaceae bacterium]MCB9005273.1 mucoidy inhibitor MuiA family protein [Ardenticatenaceae bacterium]
MDITVESTVTDVTVYPDRARVTLRGECMIKPGVHRLQVDELPLLMETESVRVMGQGTAKVRLLGVDVSRHHYTETPSEKVRELEQQIEQLEDDLRTLQDDKTGWLAQAKYLDGLRQSTAEFAKGLARGRIDVAQQSTLLTFLQEEDGRIRAATRELDQQQRELNRQLDKLRRELKALQSARPRERYQANMDVEALSEGDFTLSLSFVVRKAGWRPLYDVRFLTNGDAPRLAVSYIAEIFQNTGQDWPDVAVTVSTARPALNQRLPELRPWFVDEWQPQVMAKKSAPTGKRMRAEAPAPAMDREDAMLFADAAPPEPQPVVAEVAVAEVQSGGTAVSFKVGGSVDIPGDGSPHKTTVSEFEFAPKVDYLAVPKHTDAVFRRATLTNDSPSPLLAGSASLFVDEEFIGQTKLEYVPTNGELELLLGVEERITIERELARRDVDKRLLKDNRQLRYGYKMTAKNLLETAVQLELHDHIPVPRHEQIKVRLENAQPAPAKQSDLNLLEWHLTLPAGAEQAVTYEYLVEHPRAMQVTGLAE